MANETVQLAEYAAGLRYDDLPAEAFYFTGGIDEIRRAAGAA